MDTKSKTKTLTLHAVLIRDKTGEGFTSYFTEFPEAVAEGSTQDEAIDNLFDAVSIINEYKNSVLEDELGDFVQTKPLELELA